MKTFYLRSVGRIWEKNNNNHEVLVDKIATMLSTSLLQLDDVEFSQLQTKLMGPPKCYCSESHNLESFGRILNEPVQNF